MRILARRGVLSTGHGLHLTTQPRRRLDAIQHLSGDVHQLSLPILHCTLGTRREYHLYHGVLLDARHEQLCAAAGLGSTGAGEA